DDRKEFPISNSRGMEYPLSNWGGRIGWGHHIKLLQGYFRHETENDGTEKARFQERVVLCPETPGRESNPVGLRTWLTIKEPLRPLLNGTGGTAPLHFRRELFIPNQAIGPEIGDTN